MMQFIMFSKRGLSIMCLPFSKYMMSTTLKKGGQLNKVCPSSLESLKPVLQPGHTLLVGGFGLCGIPENLIEAIRQTPLIKNLIVVSNNAGVDDFGLGLLLQSKQISKMISSYVGENHTFEQLYLNGHLELELLPQGTLAEKLRAAGAGIPAFYTPTAAGTLLEEGKFVMKYDATGKPFLYNPSREVREFHGRKYVMEEAIRGDVAIIKAWKGDPYGNLIFRKTARNFNIAVAKAAKYTIAEVEEIVPVGSLDPDAIHLPGIYVQRIVQGEHYLKKIERLKFLPKGESSSTDIKRDRIVQRAAEEIKDGMYVNLGIGLPVLVTNYLSPTCTAQIQTENGMLGMDHYPNPGHEDADLINAGKETVTEAVGASYFSSDESFAMIRGGHIDLTILGGMEVSENGDLANWIIPGKMVKGMGGAMDLASAHNTRVIVTMEHVSKNGKAKLLNKCHLPLTAPACVDRIITDMGVFDTKTNGNGLTLVEIFQDIRLEDLKAATEARFDVSPNLKIIEI